MDRSRRIVFYMNILRDGAGMINREIGFCRQLHKSGYNVTVLSHFKPTRISPDHEIKVCCIWWTRYLNVLYDNPIFFPLTFVLLILKFLVLRPEIVFADLYREGWWAVMLRPLFRYKVVFTYHGVADSRFYSGRKKIELDRERALTHKLLKKVDEVIIVSDFMKSEVEKAGVEAVTIYNGVETVGRFSEVGVSEKAPVAVFVGRFTEYKGAFNVIKAFKIVHAEIPQARLKMFGYLESPDYLDEINSFISDNNLEEVVELSNAIDGSMFAATVGGAAVFVNGSVDETFGMPVLEAQALGVPCVGFRAGGIPEVVKDGETGLLANEGDIDMYAGCVCRILSDSELRKDMGEKAIIHAETFLYSRLVEQVVRVVERCNKE